MAAPLEPANARCNWQSYPVTLRNGTRVTQSEILRWFADRGIACRGGLTNAHQEPAYAAPGTWAGGPLPVSEQLRETTIMLPLFHGMTQVEEQAVVAAILDLR